MKKIILILILVAGAGAGTYYWKSSNGDKKDAVATSLAKIERGSVKQIVATTGKVVSNLDVDIKCKASGTVDRLPFDISDPVQKDAVVCEINKRDMNRVVSQATVSLNSSQAKLATAQQNLVIAERTLTTDRDRAEANLGSAEVAAKDARAKADRMNELFEKKLASQEDLDTAETSATQAQSLLQSCRIKLEELKTQEQGLEVQRQNVNLAKGEVQADQIALDIANDAFKDCTVLAPMDGVVTDRKIQEGTIIASAVSNVAGGTTILTLSDLSRIFVLASVDESDIGKVQLGQPATITADAYPGTQFVGKVVRIASKGVNLQNVVTFEVKIEVVGAIKRSEKAPASGVATQAGGPSDAPAASTQPAGPRGKGEPGQGGRRRKGSKDDKADAGQLVASLKNLLKPEMTANIEITTAERKDVLLIPIQAISRLSGRFFANVPDVDETPLKKPVEIGISDSDNYELLSGLAENDTVVINNGMIDSRWSNNGQRGQQQQRGGNSSMRVMRMGGGR
jgi:HlyD family secretion protein